MVARRQRLLFFAEAVTLAHVARPFVLAQFMAGRGHDVHFAADPHHRVLFGAPDFSWRNLNSLPSECFLSRLASGERLYRASEIEDYVQEDMLLIQEVQPDVVVGDFRLSLAVSARLARVPYIALTNAYWSPYARPRYRLPAHPLTRRWGVALPQFLFRLLRPAIFAFHSLPLNRVRRTHDLSGLGWDLRRVYTEADYTLYADIPELVPTAGLPANHVYIGPLLWSPIVDMPAWWERLPTDRPIVYVSLGSSGQGELLPGVLTALSDLPVTIMAATAGRADPRDVPANAYVSAYLPGEAAARRAQLVICNGGSPTSQQALAAGVPVLGVAGNLDQYLNMDAVERVGAGRLMRSDCFDAERLRSTVMQLLTQESYTRAAREMATAFARYAAVKRFAGIVEGLRVLPGI